MVAIGLLNIAFIVFKYGPCIPDLSKTFNMKRYYWILSKAFSTSHEIIMFFFFQFVYMIYQADGFLYIEPPL